MALFHETFYQEISQLLRQHHHELGITLGTPTPPPAPQFDLDSPLRRDLQLLMQIANGEHQRSYAGKALLYRVEQALQRVVELLFGNALRTHVAIPDDFWGTNAGILVSRVRWWLSADELITISNAAALAFGENSQANRMRIARAMEKGLLAWIPDPSIANPQQNKRVLRSQVERLQAQSHLPE